MSETSTSIYRSDHILGLIDGELNDGLYRHWGTALAQMLPAETSLIVSADGRYFSQEFKAALIDGLLAGRINVVDLGTAPMDLTAFGEDMTGAAGHVCINGGSSPPEWSGLRWSLKDSPFSKTEQVERLQLEARSPSNLSTSERRGTYRQLDISYSWISWLQNVWYDTPGPSLRILVDPLHGNWSVLARQALQAVFPQMVFEAVHDEPLVDFGGLPTLNRSSKALETLSGEVRRQEADLGFTLDVDAGLFAVVDRFGVPLLPGELGWFFMRYLLGPALENEIFLHDIHCPEQIVTEGIRRGATPVVSRRGDDSFVTTMRKTNAIIGLGSEGEFYFRGARGNRITVFAICWLIDYLAANGVDLSILRKTFPRFFVTPEIRTPCTSMDRIIARLSEEWSSKPETTIEGIRFHLPGGRLHIRPIPDFAQTGFRFEAENRQALNRIVTRSAAALEGIEHVGLFLNEQYGLQTTKQDDNDEAI